MIDERSENEPDEYDPEAEFRDPNSDSLTIPRVETEDAGSTLTEDLKSDFGIGSGNPHEPSIDTSDVPAELKRTFWAIVLVVNAAVFAVSLGVIFLIFHGISNHAIALLVGGVLLFGMAHRRYRNYRASQDDSRSTDGRDEPRTDGDENESDLSRSETTSRDVSEGYTPDDTDHS
ncbi:DUF7322 domain-containing protein [Natrialba swarupiae]|uniref:DUF7322 domain-containing protein n=1 Tax=Natrialba swarupiae TaxID=2448032 RepID=A0A5D5AN57_9EURY|nr:hypothetical protein [Natrialba swarupiae]MCW8172721.1 hypothetical protein [Natrialba swarupiae]TYT60840.1 hypothetical protein FYC77_16555 [Natrialba swarupiae]